MSASGKKSTRPMGLFGALLALSLAAMTPAGAAERVLELRLDGAQETRVHNLVGTVRVVPGSDELVIRATVSADEAEIADAVRLATRERDGVLEVVVEYPGELSRIRYDGKEFQALNARLDYQGRTLRVTRSGGERVRVDLEIEVPAGARLGLRHGIGPVAAEQVDADLALAARYGHVTVTDGVGSLRADTASGRVTVAGFRGDVLADTGSGRVRVENVLGDVAVDTGSGDAELRGIDGDILVDTGSGSVEITDARTAETLVDTGSGSVSLRQVSGSLKVDTGSGSVRGSDLVAGAELDVDTGSGGVDLSGDLSAVRRVVVDTGSGKVKLQSSQPLSLRLSLSTGSGGIRVDASPLSDVETGRSKFRGVVGDGAGSARISTGSGGIRIIAP